MTVPIARLVATRYPTAEPPLRFCYVAHAYRAVPRTAARCASSSRPGSSSSARRAPPGTAEALTVLCRALDAVGLTGYRVGLGDAALYPNLMAASTCTRRSASALLHELATKDLVGLEREVRELGLPPTTPTCSSACRSCAAAPTSSKRRPARSPTRSPGCATSSTCSSAAVAERVIFDLGLARGLGYYSGAVFDVYDPALGAPLGGGGRYDDLLGRFGRAAAGRRLRASASTGCTPRCRARSG